MKFYAVIGLGFGDEGKGQVVHNLCFVLVSYPRENPIVVRYSGGPQSGHTVINGDIKHIFASFGSGTLFDVPTYIARECLVDPVALMREYDVLIEKDIRPKIYICPDCRIIIPHDIDENNRVERKKGNGSCMAGIATAMDRNNAGFRLRASDMKHENILPMKIHEISDHYYRQHMDMENMEIFYEAIDRIKGIDNIVYGEPSFNEYDSIVFEGSQGLLLDRDFGFFPHVSRGKTGTRNILDFIERKFGLIAPEISINLVTRAYQTRHGNGPMTNREIFFPLEKNIHEINIYNDRQGVFKRSMLALDLIEYAIDSDEYIRHCQNKKIIVTCIDNLIEYKFTYKNKIIECPDKQGFLDRISDILKVKTEEGRLKDAKTDK